MASIKKRKRKNGSTSYTAEVRRHGFKPIAATFDNMEDAEQWAANIETEIKKARVSNKVLETEKAGIPVIDEWQIVPLSHVIELYKLVNFYVDSADKEGGYEPNTSDFIPECYPDVESFRTYLIEDAYPDDFERKNEYIEALCPVYGRYLELVKPMIAVIKKVDPTHVAQDKFRYAYTPVKELFEYCLIYDDTGATPATIRQVMDFQFSDIVNRQSSIIDILRDAVEYGRSDVIAAIGLNNEYSRQDRFKKLVEDRKAKLKDTYQEDLYQWAGNKEYASLLHQNLKDLPKLIPWGELKIINEVNSQTKFRFKLMGEALWQEIARKQAEKETGDRFRQWFKKKDSPELRAILTDILGINLNACLEFGLSLSEAHKVLGVGADATKTQIKAAYRKMAMAHHPDRGGDAEQFKKIQKAYDSLVA